MAKKSKKMIEQKIKRHVTIKLTDPEMLGKAKELSDTIAQIRTKEEHKKMVLSGLKEELNDLKGYSRELSEQIRTGEERRYIDVIRTLNFELGIAVIVNPETGEEISRETLTTEDRQLKLIDVEALEQHEENMGEEQAPKKKSRKKSSEIRDVINLETHRKTKQNSLDT